MYMAIVSLTMLVLPAGSVLIEHAIRPEVALMLLVGRWFVFWGVGVRLGLAGVRQLVQPAFTARQIFGATSDEALVVIQELGVANLAAAVVALLSLLFPTLVVPAATYATIFFGVAGVRHFRQRRRSTNETVAMISDLFLALLLAASVASAVLTGPSPFSVGSSIRAG